jgi:hypothetical protein
MNRIVSLLVLRVCFGAAEVKNHNVFDAFDSPESQLIVILSLFNADSDYLAVSKEYIDAREAVIPSIFYWSIRPVLKLPLLKRYVRLRAELVTKMDAVVLILIDTIRGAILPSMVLKFKLASDIAALEQGLLSHSSRGRDSSQSISQSLAYFEIVKGKAIAEKVDRLPFTQKLEALKRLHAFFGSVAAAKIFSATSMSLRLVDSILKEEPSLLFQEIHDRLSTFEDSNLAESLEPIANLLAQFSSVA